MAKSPDPVDRRVGDHIRTRRAELGLTQSYLGAITGVSIQQIQKYENGRNRISASRLLQIADALRVPVSSLFEGEYRSENENGSSENFTFECFSEFLATKDGHNLIRSFSRITDRKLRRCIVRLAEFIAQQETEANR